jgi:polysaccharide biosynthesis transport protein
MLQVDPQVLRSGGAAHEPAPEIVSLKDLLLSVQTLLRRQLPYILLTLFICVGLATAYVLAASKKYTSTTALIIDSRKTQLLQQQSSPMGVDAPLDSATVDSQVEIITSERVALSVIKDLDLLHNPEFVSTEPGLFSSVMDFLFGSEVPSERALTRAILRQFLKNLNVKRRALSYVIDVSYKSKDPDLSAQIANSVAEAYFVDALEAKYQASKRASGWLQDRLKELRAQASSADRAVVDYKAKNNIVDAGGRLLTEQQLAETNSSLTIARAQTAEAQARYDQLTSILKDENRGLNDFFNDVATVTDSLRNDVITRLRQQYLDLAARESDWSKRYGPQHLAVVNLRNQMREIRRSISDELRRIGETYKSDLEIAKAREVSIQTSLRATIDQSNDTSQAQIVLRDLESNAQSSRALADNFLQLYMLSVQQQSFPMTDARLITDATPDSKPSDPKTLIILLGAIVGGGLLGFGVGWLRDTFDRVIRTPKDIEAFLFTTCLAVVPKLAAKRAGQPRKSGLKQLVSRAIPAGRSHAGEFANPDENRRSSTQPSNLLVIPDTIIKEVQAFPFSRFTESIRSIKVAADLRLIDQKDRVLGFFSALPNEGKTTIAGSLAQIIAMSGSRVILVDADLRNPSLTRTLAPDAHCGLLDVVQGRADLDSAILKDPVTGLSFLPTVSHERISHSSEILSSMTMSKIVSQLRGRYDWVIVDLPPLSPIVDVRSTVRLIDVYVLVVEWGRTDREAITQSLKDAPVLSEKVMGAILNKADLGRLNRYDTHRGGYHYNRYYGRYGYVE